MSPTIFFDAVFVDSPVAARSANVDSPDMSMEGPPPKGSDKEIVVFCIRRDTKCEECGSELYSGSLLRVEKGKGLCMECADLDHLEFLGAGDAALTRRASKHSALRAVVVRWSRTRNRYERQGILVEEAAIRKAEEECLADADLRERRKQQAAVIRQAEDREFVAAFASAIRAQFPHCPTGEETVIARHACQKHSGRVGRSAAAKQFDEQAVKLAVIAHIRHTHTDYDRLLGMYMDRFEARAEVQGKIERLLAKWEGV